MVVHPLESSARPTRSIRGALPSIAVHAAIILVAVHATAHAALPHAAREKPPIVQYVPMQPAPPIVNRVRVSPTPVIEAVVPPRPSIDFPTMVPTRISIPTMSAAPVVSTGEFGRGVAPIAGTGISAAPEQSSIARTLEEVDRAVVSLGSPPTPAYPEALRSSGIRGSVTAEFVVDTLGRVEPESFRAIVSDNDLFTTAVRAAVLRTRFHPAESGGRRVRQLVQESFSFVLQ